MKFPLLFFSAARRAVVSAVAGGDITIAAARR